MQVREIALKLLGAYESGDTYINLSLNSHLTDGLSPENRAFLTSLLYATVEHKITLDYEIGYLSGRALSDISGRALDILRLGLCQILYFDRIPDFAAVNETVKLAGNDGERAFVNGVLRRAVKEKDSLPLPPKEKNVKRYLSVKYSMPLSTVKLFSEILGDEDTEKLLEKFSEQPPLTLRINTMKIDKDAYLSMLKREGIEAGITQYSDVGVRVFSHIPPTQLPGFSDGLFFVQDEASQIEGMVLDAHDGETIIDVCSAPGGKSFDAAIRMKTGTVFAMDLHESKLSLIRDGAKRLGISFIRVAEHDATAPMEDLIGKADRVICDVPCSGLGVLWKKPDLRYADFSRTEELPKLGLSILSGSAAYVKDGGLLLYSTCTVNPKENGEVVDAFLREHPDFSPEPFTVGDIVAARGDFTFFPHIHGTDGFYIAKLRKKQADL